MGGYRKAEASAETSVRWPCPSGIYPRFLRFWQTHIERFARCRMSGSSALTGVTILEIPRRADIEYGINEVGL